MAINFNNQNQGIGALNLGDFGLQQPEENMTVAEAINFGTLPQAQEKFEPDFGGMLDATRTLGKSYKGTTKGDFIDAIEAGAFGPGSNQMFDRNIGDVFEGIDLGKAGMFSFGDVAPTLKGTSDGTFRNTLDIDRGALSPEALESLPQGFFKGVGNQSSLGLPTNDKYAMSISNYDDLFGPTTMTDAFGTIRSIPGSPKPDMYTGLMDAKSGVPVGTSVGITDRGRGMPGAPTGAYEMIGGTPVAIGDVLGRQQALEKADFYEETPQGINYDVLGAIGTLGGLLTGSTALKGLGMFGNIKSGRTANAIDAVSKGLGSFGSRFAGKMRGINPITGKPNTQSQYEQARADRKQQSRVDYVADRLAKGKKTLSDPYSIAKNEAQRQQIRDGRIKGAEKKAAKDPYSGYGSCFIAGTKVSMADGTFKNIEYVKVGDKIKGHKEDNTVIKLDPTSLGDRKLYSFNNNKHYFFTSEHPFMTEEGWKSIKPEKTKERDGVELYEQLKGELKVGDKLVTDNGLVEITNIDSKEMNSPEMSLYNFNVSNDNSYIADGYIVHNKGGGGGKIVCTMMNERYGFGSFRNKIWMKFHEHHGPEYQKGYHAIFLPLVKIAKGKGKINTAVRKVLEHMGRHVTADMFKIMKGKKRDTLGRIYRAIFEPTCHIIGKIKSALGRG